MGQKAGEKWAAAVDLQPATSKSDRLLGFAAHRLPSSSPANASWSFERKCAAWREVFSQYLSLP